MKHLLILVAAGSLSVQAGFVSLDLSSIINADATELTNGTNYPAPGPITLGGIPFTLGAFAPTGNLGMVIGEFGVPTSFQVTGLNIPGVTTMYYIMNSSFGSCGTINGNIGAETEVAGISNVIIQGEDIRDHYFGDATFCQTATEVFATKNFPGSVRLDVYKFDISWATKNGTEPVITFNFNTSGKAGFGEPMLFAVTFGPDVASAIPEPSTVAFAALGLLALGALRRRVTT